MKAETMEKCHILACFLDCSICFLTQLRPICPDMAPAAVGSDLPRQSSNKNIPHKLAKGPK